MKIKKMLALGLTLALAVTTILTGCGKEGKVGKEEDQYVNYVFNTDLRTADPSLNDDTYGGLILNDILEPLTRVIVKEDGSEAIEAAGATEWKMSEDGLTYTFKIRDFKWEDGQKVTAEQYAYSILRTLDPNTGSTYSYLLAGVKNAMKYNEGACGAEEVGVKSPDDNTLVITLEAPAPYFMSMTYFPIFVPQRKDLIEKHGEKFGADAETLLACGPFRMKEWQHDSKIVLEKNNTYWDKDKVKLNTVNIKVIKEEESRYQEFYTGGLDMVVTASQEWRNKFNESGKVNEINVVEPTTLFLMMNHTTIVNDVKIFSNPKTRKAFSVAIDRKEICDLIYEGTVIPATAYIPNNLKLNGKEFREIAKFDPVTKLIEDVKDPKALFIEGLKELGADPDPSKYTLTYLVGNPSASAKKNAEIFQQQLQEALGVKINILQVESGIRDKRVADLDYDFVLYAWLGDYNDPATFMDMWRTTAPVFATGYANTEYDKIIDEAGSITDQDKRLELYKQAEKLLIYDDAVIAPFGFNIKVEHWGKHVKNVMIPTFGSIAELKYAYIEDRK